MQAIAEAGYTVAIPEDEKGRWDYAAQFFDLRYVVGSGQPVQLGVDHDKPLTSVGCLSRPLLFPHRVLDLYRLAWTDRTIPASFVGKINDVRAKALARWVGQIVPSDRGREWPGKGWDPGYAAVLGASRFALCPVSYFSDQVRWTYRFFEACAAGAVPLVDQVSPLYDGFIFGSMSASDVEWSEEIAVANYERVRLLLTASHDEIRNAVNGGSRFT